MRWSHSDILCFGEFVSSSATWLGTINRLHQIVLSVKHWCFWPDHWFSFLLFLFLRKQIVFQYQLEHHEKLGVAILLQSFELVTHFNSIHHYFLVSRVQSDKCTCCLWTWCMWMCSIHFCIELQERPLWMRISSLDALKTKLGHVIVMILLVKMFEKSKTVVITSTMDLLFYSVSIFLSSASLFVLTQLHR